MSSVSEQDHLNPRDPLYYAPRGPRERIGLLPRGRSRHRRSRSPVKFRFPARKCGVRSLAASARSRSNREPELEKALWRVAAASPPRSARPPLWLCSSSSSFPLPGRATANRRPSLEGSCNRSSPRCSKPARLRRNPPSTNCKRFSPPAARRPGGFSQSEQLLQQFMQWREKPIRKPKRDNHDPPGRPERG